MQTACPSYAQEETARPQKAFLFQGEVNADDINIRSDSTSNSEVICKINKSQTVDVISELYDWYKIKLPTEAPSFINKEFTSPVDNKTAKVMKDNVNIRLKPNTSSAILGRVNTNEVVIVLEERGDWYRIEPVKDSAGWIHKNFVNKLEKKKTKLAKKDETVVDRNITLEGIIRPKTFTRVATHKLITEDDKVYLLRGDRETLNSLNKRRARITGKLVDPTAETDPIVEVEKIEALD